MKNQEVKTLVLNALFVALTFLLGLTPIGIIPLGAINVTIMHIPVILGALFLGWQSGLLLGFVFGTCSFMSAMGLSMTPPSGLAAALGGRSVILLALMCYIPRLLVPLVAYTVNELLKRTRPGSIAASACGSLTNSIFYLGLMMQFYKWAGMDLNELASKLGLEKLSIWGLIAVIFTGAGVCEALAAAILVPTILAALEKAVKH